MGHWNCTFFILTTGFNHRCTDGGCRVGYSNIYLTKRGRGRSNQPLSGGWIGNITVVNQRPPTESLDLGGGGACIGHARACGGEIIEHNCRPFGC